MVVDGLTFDQMADLMKEHEVNVLIAVVKNSLKSASST